MTGLQSAVRVPFDQMRRDRSGGLHTAAFVSGYPGSPVGGFDMELGRRADLMRELDIVHRPGLNEELAATAVMGSQTAGRFGAARFDGVLGIWYGKAPGLERAGDAIRHANYWGTTRHSGTLVIVGDDPACKSSSVPSASEQYLADLGLPILCPGNAQEVLDFGLHAIALSRSCGLWVALKLVTAVADGFGTVTVSNGRLDPVLPTALGEPEPGRAETNPINPATIVQVERDLREVRLDAARRYLDVNELNRVSGARTGAIVGIVAPSHTMHEVLEALQRMRIDAQSPASRIRLWRLGALHPLDHEQIRQFAQGLAEVIVIEEKQPFVEREVVQALYGIGGPAVAGKRTASGSALFPAHGALDADAIFAPLRSRISALLGDVPEQSVDAPVRRQLPLIPARTPYYCSGCPHNTSTQVPAGSAVGAGIGCHSIVGFLDTERFGTITGVTQMGGEGAQWIGAAPFTQTPHLIQNLGDGTFFHSGQLAIQAAVAADAHITYKLLFNGTIAMTGGQPSPGGKDIPAVVRMLNDFGVARILITTEDPRRYRKIRLPRGVDVWHRRRMLEAQEKLSRVPGVTVLIHDQHCAAHARQLRKRGQLPDPPRRVAIAARVCELCGDCGYKSNCLSVRTIDTEFGPKTTIDQSSCNKDYSCLEGDCPSFVSFLPSRFPARRRRRSAPGRPVASGNAIEEPMAPQEFPDPQPVVSGADFTVRMAGIGGTGVVTVNQILGVAAQLDGYEVAGLDQTGLSQKGGAVISDLRISRTSIDGSNKAAESSADLLLIFDQLVALSPANSRVADPTRTVAVVSTTQVATGGMIGHPDRRFPEAADLRDALDELTIAEHNRYVDAAALTNELFGSTQTSNVFLLGVAYQAGALPVQAASIERAIDLNATLVETNLAAFRAGRAWVLDPTRLPRTAEPATDGAVASPAIDAVLARLGIDGELHAVVRTRAADLADYQDERYALRYLDVVQRAVDVESSRAPGSLEVSSAVAHCLHKVMAYKDEYEVPRLLLLPAVENQLRAAVGPGQRMYWHLHPPVLRALGMRRKLRLGPWFRPVLYILRSMRRLRGTRLDPFGATVLRRAERALITEYTDLVDESLTLLTADNRTEVVELLSRIEKVRGYEHIKMDGIDSYRAEVDDLRARMG